jgi:hypothetical protein
VVQVYAGLAKLDSWVLGLIVQSRMSMYFQIFTSVLLTQERYAVPVAVAGCGSNCSSFILPGGLETAWVYDGSFLGSTLLERELFQAQDAIRIEDAPAFLLKYETLHPDVDFDRGKECSVYGHGGRDSIQICVRSTTPSIEVGEFIIRVIEWSL